MILSAFFFCLQNQTFLQLRLSGTLPFDDNKAVSIFDQIKRAEYSFDGPIWAGISRAAKHLISWLLVVSTNERLTAQKLLKHPWITGDKHDDTLPLSFEQVHQMTMKKRKRR